MADFEIRETGPISYMYIQAETATNPEAMGQAFQRGFPALLQFMTAKGVQPTGAPFSVNAFYHHGDTTRFRIAMPCEPAHAALATGEIEAGELPAQRVVHSVHRGPYEGLGDTYNALVAWMQAQKLTPAMPSWEVYVDDPVGTAPEEVRTEIFLPIASDTDA